MWYILLAVTFTFIFLQTHTCWCFPCFFRFFLVGLKTESSSLNCHIKCEEKPLLWRLFQNIIKDQLLEGTLGLGGMLSDCWDSFTVTVRRWWRNIRFTITFKKKNYCRGWTGILVPNIVNACITLLLYLPTPPRCYNGYYGQPMVPGGSCQPCHCHGNLDFAVPDSCDPVTGQCLSCRQGYSGTNCESCAEGYYGDAITAKNCQCK